MKKALFSLLFVTISIVGFGQTKDNSINATDTTISTDKIIFTQVDIESEFPGGTQAWIRFLQRSLKADIPAKNGAPAGKYNVIIQFVIDKDGIISDIKPIEDPGYGCYEEVKRLLKKSPKWNPGIQNGIKVKSYKKQLVTFVVD